IKIKDGNIELGCPKMVWVKCAGFQVMGPNSAGVNMQGIPAVEKYDEQFQLLLPDSSPMRFVEYNIRSGEQEITGKTTSKGISQRIHTEQKQELEVELKWVGFTADLPSGDA
ncbi:MAG: hypothetical protein Q4D78_08565, partial [Neisseria zoodegmatis]|nr:hypothetical protein [Neisseria zoodegmatis]